MFTQFKAALHFIFSLFAGLLEFVEQYMIKVLNESNCYDFRDIAYCEELNSLKMKSNEFLTEHITSLSEQTRFLELFCVDIRILLEDDSLNVSCFHIFLFFVLHSAGYSVYLRLWFPTTLSTTQIWVFLKSRDLSLKHWKMRFYCMLSLFYGYYCNRTGIKTLKKVMQ